jgi:phenylacetate-CoA ligase
MAHSLRTTVINAVPEWLLTLMVNGLGFYYRLNRYSSSMQRTLVEWRKLEDLSTEEYRNFQLQRFRYIAKVAQASPYYQEVYRQVGFDPENIRSMDDLKRLPHLTKDDLRKHGSRMIVPNNHTARIRRYSSGTTGEPVNFVQPKRMAFDQGYAMLYQFYGWYGFAPLRRRATMAGRYMGQNPLGIVARNLLENQLLLGVHALSEKSVARYVQALNKFKPELFQAHPSALLMLKQYCETAGQMPPKLPLVTFTGESLSEHERSQLCEWLQGAVMFGTYGSGENVLAACECRQLNGYHIHPAIGICELEEIDGNREIIGTSLLNDVMPMIRYRMGDLADQISTERCACGLSWPRIQGIQGRIDDLLVSENGALIAPVVLRTGIAALGVLSVPYSIIQHVDQSIFTLLLYADPTEIHKTKISEVLSHLRRTLGETSEIAVKFVPRRELLTARAKHRIVIKERARNN